MGFVALVTLGSHKIPGAVELARAEDKPLLDALHARGVDARSIAWTDGADALRGASLIIVRTPWDYPWQLDAFLAWLGDAARVAPVWNPPALIRWNAHKSYLFDLEARGVPIVPGLRVPRGGTVDVGEMLREHGELVIKPTVDAGAMNAMRVTPERAREGQAHLDALASKGEVLVQPFLRAIATEGERSLVYFGGLFSHAVRKLPARGDYRVQDAYGGRSAPHEPSAADRALADRALAACGHPTLHARVDIVTANDGRPVVIELEVIEPSFYLVGAPGSALRYADAVRALL